ncbi:MAG: RNA polymerase sigma factor [Planctomycetaceae bacterium]|nr:RNA polymerase sigma factor [Planctomycetaceae bacterium]
MDIQHLWHTHVRGLILYARQWADREAEDVVQDAFLKLLAAKPPPDEPKAWLYRVVRNTAIDRLRKKRWFRPPPLDNWFENLPDRTQPFDGVELTQLLETLPQHIREIVIAKIWGNLTFREIAELTQRPISSVHSDYQNGIDRLKKELGDRN